MRTNIAICQFIVAALFIMPACDKTGGKKGDQARTDTTVYVLNTMPSQEKEFFDGYSEKDVLDFIYFSAEPGKRIKDTTYIVDFQLIKFPPEWENAEDTALYVSVLLSKEDIKYQEDLSEGLVEFLLLRMSGGMLEVVTDTVITERRKTPVAREGAGEGEGEGEGEWEEPMESGSDDFPVPHPSLKVPGDAGNQKSIYQQFSEKDILEFIYAGEPAEGADQELSYFAGYQVLTGDLAALADPSDETATGEEAPGVIDSAIVVLVAFAPCDPELDECTEQYYDLVILSASEGSLSVIAREGFGPYVSFREAGGGGREEGLVPELYRISPSASAIGLYYSFSEGTDLSGEGSEELDLYIVGMADELIIPVLSLEMGSSSYEYDFAGPEGSSSGSSVIESEITVTDEVLNGCYKIIHTVTHREFVNREVTSEESSSTSYVWEAASYVPLVPVEDR